MYRIMVEGIDASAATGTFALAASDFQMELPGNGSSFTAPSALVLRARRVGMTRNVAFVEFLMDGTVLGQVDAAAPEMPLMLDAPGYHSIEVRATDTRGLVVTPDPIGIVVRPAHDAFNNAQEVSGYAFEVETSNRGATQDGDPVYFSNVGGHSLWYRWTAPHDGLYLLRGQAVGFHPVMNVFVQSQALGLSPVILGVFGIPGAPIGFQGVAGTTYFICVDSFWGEKGS